MITKTLWKGLTAAANWFYPQQKALGEANDQALNKREKVETFQQMNDSNDHRLMQQDDRDIVNSWRWSKMNCGTKNDPGNQDAIVCDNMTIDNSRGGFLELVILGLILLAVMHYGFGWGKQDTEVQVKDAEYQVRFYDKDMNPIPVERLPQQPKGE